MHRVSKQWQMLCSTNNLFPPECKGILLAFGGDIASLKSFMHCRTALFSVRRASGKET